MSRSGYTEDLDWWHLIMWRGRVASAIRGKRGQALLRDLLAALDAMPEKRLIANELEAEGEVCALGAVGRLRGIDLAQLDPEDADRVAGAFDVATCLAQEITYINDEYGPIGWDPVTRKRIDETPEQRWQRVRDWAVENLRLEER